MAIYGAAVAVTAAPLMIGSGPPWAQLLASALVFGVAVLFVLTRGFAVRSIPFALPAALAVAATAFQLVPLPSILVRLLSPRAFELRAEATGGAAPFFMPLTLDVPATVLALAKAMACLALLVVVGTAARRLSRARPLVISLAFVGAAVALAHIVQRLTGATRILGLYHVADLPGTGFFGTFVNGNQATSLLALSGLIAAGLALEATGLLRTAAGAAAALSIGVLVTTGSRAGLLGFAFGALAFGTLMLARRLGRTRALIVSLALVGLASVGTVLASDVLRNRIAATAADHMSDQKIRGWRDALKVVGAYPAIGVGRGAFEAPASAFRSDSEGVRLAFPENILLQLACEWGVPVSLALLALVTLACRRTLPALPRLEPTTKAAACGVLAVAIHELADFGLELPGVAFPAAAALGLVVARSQQLVDPRREQGRRLGPRPVSVALAGMAVVLALGLWAVPRTLLADGDRLRAAVIARDADVAPRLAAAIARHPADYYLELLAGTVAIAARDPSAGRHLGRAQRLNPTDRNVHLATARWLARNGRHSQAAIEYRLAREKGAIIELDELWSTVGPRNLASAIQQTDFHLLEAASYLWRKGHLEEARAVSARAVEVARAVEPALVRRLALAVETRSPAFIEEAGRSLVAAASEPAAFVEAATALARIDKPALADAAIEQGLVVNPHDSAIVIAGARLRMARSDLTGAVSMLQRAANETLTLKDRIQFEEIQAEVAQKRGDVAGAAAFNARARSLSRLTTVEAER